MDIDYTTNLRGIAILFVVLHHVSNVFSSNLFTPLGGIGVSIFLILSGYGLNESYQRKGLLNFWKSKTIRVILPCWLIEIIFLFFERSAFDYVFFLKHLLCIDRNWYIRYLFYWYLLFYCTTKYFAKYRIGILAIFSLIFLIILPEIESEQSFSFLCGLFLSEYKGLKKVIAKKYLIWGGIFLFLGMSFLVLKQLPSVRNFEGSILYDIIQMVIKWSVAFGLIILYKIISNHGYKLNFFSWLGTISYELYLTHCKFLFLLNKQSALLCIIAFYGISLVTAFLLYQTDKHIAIKLK